MIKLRRWKNYEKFRSFQNEVTLKCTAEIWTSIPKSLFQNNVLLNLLSFGYLGFHLVQAFEHVLKFVTRR